MDLKNFKQSYRSLKTEVGMTRISLAGCAIALALLSFNALTKSTTVIIQPYGMQTKAYVSEKNASHSYKESWALFLAELLGNISPGNLDFVKESIIPLLPSNLYQTTVTNLNAQVQMMKKNRVTTSFAPTEYTYEKSTDKVFVYGFYTITSPSVKPKREKRTYEFKISIDNYLPQILSMDTYEGEPRTQKVLEILKKKAEEKAKKAKEKGEKA